MKYIYLYLLTIPIFAVFDLIWLGIIARNFYQSQLGHLLGEVNWYAAGVFYLLYIAGILVFAVVPALGKQSLMYAAVFGALFGFFTYATYDLTNMATLRDWPLLITVVDIVWGSVLGALVASTSFWVATRFLF